MGSSGAGGGAGAATALLDPWLDVALEASTVAYGVISVFEVRYVRANAALGRLYGMPVEVILDADPFALASKITHPDDLAAEQTLFAALAVGARRSYTLEKRFVRPDGSIRWGDLTFSGIYDTPADPATPVGPLRFAVIQVVDVTERRLLADTLARREVELRHAQRVDGIGRLAAGVAHDFNNLLTVITGHGELLKRSLRDGTRSASPSALVADLDAILAASERAADLTAQLLAHGRREAVVRGTVVLSDVVRPLEQLLRRTIGSAIAVEPSLGATGAIRADKGQISQVAMNLVLNARDAMSEGGRIVVATEDVTVDGGGEGAVPGPGEWVALVVSDTGHGMSAEVRERMFEPFFTTRADRPGTQGTGLGLATVQRIVAESDGRIDVRSAPGEGTTVTVYFPRVPLSPTGGGDGASRTGPAAAPDGRRVLVVEDDPAVRALVGTVLLGAHYHVRVARSGEEALAIIAAEAAPFDLVVTDLVMPGLGGASLARRVREAAGSTRVLFISGYSSHAPADLAPFGTLLAKPFTPAELVAAAQQALEDV